MSILIRGMEMPTSCDDCRFAVDGWCYACLPESAEERRRITTNYCPLVEIPPHGDLIDRKQLIKSDHQHYEYLSDEFYITVRDIEAAPTIIEAEEGET